MNAVEVADRARTMVEGIVSNERLVNILTERFTGIGAQQYEHCYRSIGVDGDDIEECSQAFEHMTTEQLVQGLIEELADAVNYIVMLGIAHPDHTSFYMLKDAIVDLSRLFSKTNYVKRYYTDD